MRSVILVTGADLAAPAVQLLQDFELIYAGKAPNELDLIALCERHNPIAIIVRYGRITPAIIAVAPSLAVISKHGSGTDTIDKPAAQARGIAVVAAAGANAAAVAEHATALMLACAKSVTQLNDRMQQGHWDKATHKSFELRGKTIGLVGFGAIGSRFARICLAMDMKVLVYDPFTPLLPEQVSAVSLQALLSSSDVISLHCPLNDDNKHMINAATLVQCKCGVILINTARGGLVHESALLDAVRSGQVASAGLDSFEVEPMTTAHLFHGVPNIVLSPHIGGVTKDAYISMGVGAAENILNVLNKR
jgi:D-3-phosphoglycerate dehydrogenase / 2-oxoglutarate reductase